MDTINKTRILKNLDKLVENTICSEGFLLLFRSRGIFSREDVDVICAKNTHSGKSKTFYDTLLTRTDSYAVLVEALKKYVQTGALNILESTSETNSNDELRRFIQPPSYLNDSRFAILVVLSPNCSITCERITDTIKKSQLYNIADFRRMCLSLELANNECTVVLNCEDGSLPQLNYKGFKYDKMVCVTSMNKEQVTLELKSQDIALKKVPIVEEDIKWSELSQTVREKILIDIEKIEEFRGIDFVKVLPNLDCPSILCFLEGKVPTIFNETLPEDRKYYIPRRLQSRDIVSDEIFTTTTPDIYVFKNIQWHLLKEKTKKQFTQLSTKLLYQATDKVCHFIILEKDIHFDQLKSKYKNHPMHLICYEDETFFWEKSYVSIETIQKIIERQTVNQNVIPENSVVNEKLLKMRNSKYPILISDTPGMGKTCLLENIGRELKKQINQGVVAFIVISELIRDVVKRLKTSRGSPPQIRAETWKEVLIENISNNCLGTHVLNKQSYHLKELLLDGIDEIPKKYIEDFFDFMIEIQSKFPSTRIWITTRPHMFIELEQRFCVLGYNIKSFEEEDQINFLVHYWNQTNEIQSLDSIFKFAKTCLDTVKARLSKDEEGIAGIPLQCRLIGDFFEQNAKEFILSGQDNSTNEVEWPEDSRTMFVLYEKMVDKKISLFYEKEKYKSRHVERSDIKKAHYLMSISQLFPSLEKKFKQQLHTPLSRADLFNVGFLESKTMSTIPRFIHRTFQEYFLAEFIFEALLTKYSPATLILLGSILETVPTDFSINKAIIYCSSFKWNVVCYFVDAFLGNEDQNKLLSRIFCCPSALTKFTILHDCTLEDNSLVRYENNIFSLSLTKMRNIAEACAYNNLPHIFSNLLRRKNIYTDKFLVLCIVKSNFDMTKIFRNYSKLSLKKFVVESYTLLHLAVIQGNCTTVEYLLEDEPIRKLVDSDGIYNNLVSECVLNSQRQDPNVIKEKKNILRLLSNISIDLFKKDTLLGLSRGISIELAKEVLDIAPEFYAKDTKFLVNMIRYFIDTCNSAQLLSILETIRGLSPHNFRTILYALQKGSNKHSSKKAEDNFLRSILQNMKPDANFFDFLKKSGFIFEMMKFKASMFNLAIETRQSAESFHWLLQNLVTTTTDCEGLLFFSIERCNGVAVELILNFYKCGPNIKNSKGDTLLHHLFNENETLTREHYQMVDILCKKGISLSIKNHVLQTPIDKLAKTRFSSYGQKIFDLLERTDNLNAINWHFMKMKWFLYNSKHINDITFSNLFTLDDLVKTKSFLAQDLEDNTLLHFAAKIGHLTSIRVLLNAKAAINAKNAKNETPLHLLLSSRQFSTAACELLIDSGADVTTLNVDNMTPICLISDLSSDFNTNEFTLNLLEYVFHHYRSDASKIEQILLLIIWRFPLYIVTVACDWFGTLFDYSRPINKIKSKLVDIAATPLDAALLNTDVSVLEYAIEVLKCDKSFIGPPSTCMHSYILIKEPNETERYINLVAPLFPILLNAKNENGIVPLSVEGIDHTLIRPLVSFGADVNAVDNSKNTPLHWAIKHNAENVGLVIRELIALGANVNAENDMNETPLKLTLKMINKINMMECVKLLVENEADLGKVYKCETSEDTFLHLLVKEKLITVFLDIAEFLLIKGFTKLFYERNSEDKTTIQIAYAIFKKSNRPRELFRKYL